MDESHETFLSRLNLSQYLDNFREAGFDDLETVVTLSEEEIENMWDLCYQATSLNLF